MAKSRRERRRIGKPDVRRKNVNIDQAKLDRVRELLGASSETETIEQALDLLLFREELVAGMARIGGRGGVVDAYAGDTEP